MEIYLLHCGRLIDHIYLVVSDFDASKAFYTAVLAVLDIPIISTCDDYFWADELVVSSVKSSGSAGERTYRPGIARFLCFIPMVTTLKPEVIYLAFGSVFHHAGFVLDRYPVPVRRVSYHRVLSRWV
ncbi:MULTISPECIES: hypothetical protein [unclassified Serratia (in: enterobacteria)]|uniref:hypothetical protein n=1 Tax=unclassified Serratia (in: enterobacteria) TaxID=2647522 RepID=UPI001E398B69|nr:MULTISPECIES: hypothetical protein [unclassified Serratia (in: enterobacteria)]